METYHIYDFYSLSPQKVAILIEGLKLDSRFKTKLNKNDYPINIVFQAMIIDRLSLLVYSNTKDAEKGINKPKMLIDSLIKNDSNKNSEYMKFKTIKEFELYREKLLKGEISNVK